MTKPGKDRITISFYKLQKLVIEILRNHLYHEWENLGVLGKIYVAYEKELMHNYLFLHKI